ncbi:MAG: hypothetical protein NVS3B16_14620 [Vulcanimicrobiaceae bacterium]
MRHSPVADNRSRPVLRPAAAQLVATFARAIDGLRARTLRDVTLVDPSDDPGGMSDAHERAFTARAMRRI